MAQSRNQHTLPGPVGPLESLLEEPAADKGVSFGVVCHPHPLYGGTMNNKVVYTLARAFGDLGMPVLRFNFRGVGQSAGQFADGVGETADALAAIHWMRERYPGRGLWLAGFSFGGAVAIRSAIEAQPKALITVAPAIERIEGTAGLLPTCPWLVLQGDQDDLVSAAATRSWVNSLPQPPELVELAGAEHFFHGRLTDLREHLLRWAARQELA